MSQQIIRLYDNHEQAIEAAKALKSAGFPESRISLLGRAEFDYDFQIKDANIAAKSLCISTLIGVFTGLGLALIPGIDTLYGVAPVAGAVAGFDLGIIGGTIISVVLVRNIGKEIADRYEADLKAGKTLLAVSGRKGQLREAKSILEARMKMSLH